MNRSLFTKAESGIRCDLCFRGCLLKDEEIGFCGVNQNIDGALSSLTFGCPSGLQIDPVEKKPLYHFLPASKTFSIGTVGCNFRCPFCQNHTISFAKPSAITQFYSPLDIVKLALESNCRSIAFTYNEPTVSWLYYREIAKIAKGENLPTIMVTNGAMSEEVCNEMGELIDAVNIDLKCGAEQGYSSILKGSREQVIKNLLILKKYGVWIELTTLVVPDFNDTLTDLALSGEEVKEILGLSVPWHISAYHPAYRYNLPSTTDKSVIEQTKYLTNLGFKFVYTGNIARETDTVCPNCSSHLISRIGYNTTNNLIEGKCFNCNYKLEGKFL